MIQRINREEFLHRLEMVSPGLSIKPSGIQMNCFAFDAGKVYTYNDEVACLADSGLDDKFICAVKADELSKLLAKMDEEDIEVEMNGKDFLVHGVGRRAGHKMDREIQLSYKAVEPPDRWTELSDEFSEALELVQDCAADKEDKSSFKSFTKFIHITPRYIEASDALQAGRYRLRAGFAMDSLVRKSSLKPILGLAPTELCETETWMHFRNPAGLVYSCRRWTEKYPDIASVLHVPGDKIIMPKGMKEAIECASIASAKNTDINHVKVRIIRNKAYLYGEGMHSWYEDEVKIKYDGRDLEFTMSPKILSAVIERYNECVISEKFLKFDGGKWEYVTSLKAPEKPKEEKQ